MIRVKIGATAAVPRKEVSHEKARRVAKKGKKIPVEWLPTNS